ncbi:carboxypeptidase-like regulatory domain-containing protein [Flavobacteriaceae bacterium]|jgi:hypothetical protein|nr:carboxypeptidase-like regulatory domain-containing protein [Flavobacteriaceae bacterium]
MKILLSSFFTLCFLLVSAQERRIPLKGKLLYRNNNVIAANVVNNTALTNTITNGEGEFEILARVGDEIIFSSVQFRIKSIEVTAEIIKKNRLVVEVNERTTALDEIVVGPENTEKFLDLKKEEFSRVDYSQDKSTRIRNNITTQGQLTNGLNIVNIAKLLAKVVTAKQDAEKRTMVPSKVLPLIFEENFFTNDLDLADSEVVGFLEELDRVLPSDRLLKKDMEFQLIEYLYLQSEKYKKKIR